ncbi:KTSC domain-containing protein [Serratia liquefaciens]|uniref:KTSC domain-containing protein n=1 Tax=Serratia liquefaciens TaxID=614 RepID=UPI0015A1261E|nr:KTSC domain-containing protein [Serratia liquefaciens]NWA20308.1 KTSC domain-containing protein [Serratia liquefaciens]
MTININLVPVNSSQIHSIGHNPATNTLAIRFKSRGEPAALYHYSNVSADDFTAFKDAESVGSHFYKHIKADTERFPFQRINEKKDDE